MYSFIIIHELNNIIVYSILLSLRMTHVGFGRPTRIGLPRFQLINLHKYDEF